MAGAVTADVLGAAGPIRLPPLREDLHLLPGPTGHDGAPTWTLHDPARNVFIRIGWLQFEILSRWRLGRSDAVARAIGAETTIRAGEGEVASFLRFAQQAGLIAPRDASDSRRFVEETGRRRRSAAAWMLQNYLFLRIPLLNPDRFLAWLQPGLRFVFTRGFAVMIGMLAALGLHLVGQQWDSYKNQFLDLFSLEGALLVGAALFGAKIVHEFGHGLTARHFSCRVPAMGVALLALWPVLWTDTTDAWRLTDKRQRLAIDAAGMAAEIVLAVFATLAWTILPDGPARTAAFLLSSSTWIVTIAVNCNPLMRFDGYYLLSDWLEVPNLQDRGFALARAWLREKLFDLRGAPPEVFPAPLRRVVLAYALATLTYRFFLFLGIAFLVYHYGFKALGLFLMAVELWWFIARPIGRELLVWARSLRAGRLRPRALVSFAVFALLLGGLFVPWQGEISAPALLHSGHEIVLTTNQPGRLLSIPANGATVPAGATVFGLDSPNIDSRRDVVRARAAALRTQIEGQAFDPHASSDIDVSWQELGQALAELRSLDAQRDALDVRAPFAGSLRDVSPTLRPGQWLPQREPLAVLVDPADAIVEAYVGETDLARAHPGDTARFYPANAEAPVPLQVTELAVDSVRSLQDRQLASPFGGPVAARRETSGQLIPVNTIYRIVLRPLPGSGDVVRRMTGTVVINGERRSVLGEILRRAIAVAIRESNL